MFPDLINLTSTKPVLQNLPCLSWPHLSNKKGQNISSKFLNTTTSNLYIKVLALCIFYTCFFIAHAKYNMNLNINWCKNSKIPKLNMYLCTQQLQFFHQVEFPTCKLNFKHFISHIFFLLCSIRIKNTQYYFIIQESIVESSINFNLIHL